MAIEFKVDRERFPYDVYVDGSRIAVLYSSHAVQLIENTVRCNELVLQHAQRVNRLIAIIQGEREARPEDLVPAREVRYSSLSLSAEEASCVSGIEVGQVYKWPRGDSRWQVTSISGLAQVANLAWIEDPTTGRLSRTYTKSVDFDRLKKAYILQKGASSNGTSDDEPYEIDPDDETALETLE